MLMKLKTGLLTRLKNMDLSVEMMKMTTGEKRDNMFLDRLIELELSIEKPNNGFTTRQLVMIQEMTETIIKSSTFQDN
jgi:hypothetical protein